jgi:hypothetical protein
MVQMGEESRQDSELDFSYELILDGDEDTIAIQEFLSNESNGGHNKQLYRSKEGLIEKNTIIGSNSDSDWQLSKEVEQLAELIDTMMEVGGPGQQIEITIIHKSPQPHEVEAFIDDLEEVIRSVDQIETPIQSNNAFDCSIVDLEDEKDEVHFNSNDEGDVDDFLGDLEENIRDISSQ